MKSIMTRYHEPSYTKGSRITARDSDNNRVSISYDCGLNNDANHRAAVTALCKKMKWSGTLHGGGLDKHGTQVWVWVRDGEELVIGD